VKLFYERGQWDEVVRNLQEVVKLEPQDAKAYYYIGEAYRFKGDYSSAIAAYQLALGLDPNFGPGYVGLARARLGIRRGIPVLHVMKE